LELNFKEQRTCDIFARRTRFPFHFSKYYPFCLKNMLPHTDPLLSLQSRERTATILCWLAQCSACPLTMGSPVRAGEKKNLSYARAAGPPSFFGK